MRLDCDSVGRRQLATALLWCFGLLSLVCGCTQDQVAKKALPQKSTSRKAATKKQEAPKPSIDELYKQASEAFYQRRQLSKAEGLFRQILKREPANPNAHGALVYLLSITGRRWESAPHLLHLIRIGKFSNDHLAWLGALDALIVESETLHQCLKAVPDDPTPMIGLARIAFQDNRKEDVEAYLDKIHSLSPEMVEAHVLAGRMLLADSASDKDWQQWYRQLSKDTDRHPDIWSVRALHAQQTNNSRGAVRCFGEAVRLDPNHQLANYQLSQLLKSLGQPEQAKPFAQRAKLLLEFGDVLHAVQSKPQPEEQELQRAAELCNQLARSWEAAAWCAVTIPPQGQPPAWAAEMLQRLTPKLKQDTPQTLPEANPIRHLDLATYPLPSVGTGTKTTDDQQASPIAELDFADVAEEVGIKFQYINGRDPARIGSYMYEINGGGVAVLDYDLDGWPDLHFTQGTRWPPGDNQSADVRPVGGVRPATLPEHIDKLFRNISGSEFTDVTSSAFLSEANFSQGVTVGDYNSDGFPDLYVANIGGNRLYRNQGDGTFKDVTEQAGLKDSRWTSSCLLADLNGDAQPDIYDVNYLKGDDVFDRTCKYDDGPPRVCAPRVFEAEQDQVFVNLGDGRFERQSKQTGITNEDGRGLGIVAADFDGSGKINLFVANDQMHNFYFVNKLKANKTTISFEEFGLLSGLAVDWRGRGQACMGVAAGDTNRDGKLDLFVTNFQNESNTLYQQESDGVFSDKTQATGLRDASYAMLGFGTQFIDGELDGLPDLVLTNGHIDDRTDYGIPYKMRPQYFRNVGGRFVEVTRKAAGAFFDKEYLGRGLAKLDWNGDGREDFAVSHLLSPSALVTNRTKQVGHYLALRLHGIQSNRDAIGSIVKVTVGDKTWMQQLTAGDGFQASNQRQLTFGLGMHDKVDELRIRWPSGKEQIWKQPSVDAVLIAIEGNEKLVPLLIE